MLLAGNSAHQVSPFGARGANSGVQDADNLALKLDLVVKGLAPDSLLDSCCEKRVHGADRSRIGAPCADAPLADGYLLDRWGGYFTVLAINTAPSALQDVDGIEVRTIELETHRDNPAGAITARYLGSEPHGVYLIRPDQHVVARWATCDGTDIEAAVRLATGHRKAGRGH